MNNFSIVVKKWYKSAEAQSGVNEFIELCNEHTVQIIDFTSHVTETEDGLTYSFVFKIKGAKSEEISKG